jgi:hypothetical protein
LRINQKKLKEKPLLLKRPASGRHIQVEVFMKNYHHNRFLPGVCCASRPNLSEKQVNIYAPNKLPGLLALAFFVVFFCAVCSCSTGEAAGKVLGLSGSEAPVLLGYRTAGLGEITFEFSLPVKVVSLNIDPDLGVASVEDGAVVTVRLTKPGNGGEQLAVDLLVEDEQGNTLNVLVPLRTWNDRLPSLLITEMRTEMSKTKVEYVEFRTLKAGNLGALRLFIASNDSNPRIYEFSPVEVGAGEYILLHLRTTAEPGIADETGADLNLSGGEDAAAEARDFWVPGSEERFRKTDAVYFLDQRDQVIDAVMFSETSAPSWGKKNFADAADFLYKQGAWTSPEGTICGPDGAVLNTIKSSMTVSIVRDESMEDSNTAADWFIAPRNGHTPGKKNSSRPAP